MHLNLRRVITILAVMVGLVFASTTLYSAVMAGAPDTLKITKFKAKKGAVPMPHKQHVDAGIKCKKCHHKTEAGKTPAACTTCHKMPAEGDVMDAKKAFHKSCNKCHKKEAKAGKKTGPTKCGACHSG